MFFDDTENPDDWEWKYAAEKIEFWKKHEGHFPFEFFFLHEPIRRLIPFLNVVGENLQTYLEMEKAIDQGHLDNISQILFPNQKSALPTYTQRWFSEATKVSSVQ